LLFFYCYCYYMSLKALWCKALWHSNNYLSGLMECLCCITELAVKNGGFIKMMSLWCHGVSGVFPCEPVPNFQGRIHQQQCLPLYVKPCPWALQWTTRWCFDNLGGCCWFSKNLLSTRCTGLHGKVTADLSLNSSAVISPLLQP